MLYQTDNPHGGDLCGRSVEIDFSVNTNPLGPPAAARRAVAAAADLLDRYPDPGCRALTAALSALEGVPRERILCGCGAAELIYSFCAAVRPRRALELAPTFSEYSAALAAVDCQVERYPLRREDGFRLTEAFLPTLEGGDWDVLFLCDPNNPTGRTIDPPLLEKIRRVCRERSIRLFVDECFLDLAEEGGERSLKTRLETDPGLFILKAFTKNFALAALRLGYCLSGDRELLAAMSRTAQPWNVSLPAQMAGAAVLRETGFLEESRRFIRRERPFLQEGLERLGLWVCPSQANYLLFYSPRPLMEPLLHRGILIRDCANYHGLGEGWYRAAVKGREENRRLVAALGEIMEEN